MRFVLFDDFKPGVIRDDKVFDISGLLRGVEPGNPRAVVRAIIAAADSIGGKLDSLKDVPVASVRLRQPVPDPVQLLCAAKNYKDGRETPKADFFLKAPGTIIGPGDTVELPPVEARVFHAEPELAFVIGEVADNVKAADAMKYVFGYTCFLDVSARGVSPTFYIHKSYVTFGPMGPAIVTADEVPDPHNLRVRMWVDDDLRQDFNTGEMANRIDKLIEVASSVCPLQPGDVFPTGTHHIGLGPVQDGETLTIEIERVGRLSVKVRDPLRRTWDRSVRNTAIPKPQPA
ncbi:MAG TPA: fumarylacetoacetate hydrolase family protein [Alphaproteobacteria bacterium]|nr:fumarylacetoacetate hydrolase family protein [Alphaproteobacteria bacterium]